MQFMIPVSASVILILSGVRLHRSLPQEDSLGINKFTIQSLVGIAFLSIGMLLLATTFEDYARLSRDVPQGTFLMGLTAGLAAAVIPVFSFMNRGERGLAIIMAVISGIIACFVGAEFYVTGTPGWQVVAGAFLVSAIFSTMTSSLA
jgi:predicted Na+-dependent transporter